MFFWATQLKMLDLLHFVYSKGGCVHTQSGFGCNHPTCQTTLEGTVCTTLFGHLWKSVLLNVGQALGVSAPRDNTLVLILRQDKNIDLQKRSRRCRLRSRRTTERQEEKRLSRKPACSDKIEETSSDDTVARKKRTRSYLESRYYSSTLLLLHTCHLSHAHIQCVHGWCSRMM